VGWRWGEVGWRWGEVGRGGLEVGRGGCGARGARRSPRVSRATRVDRGACGSSRARDNGAKNPTAGVVFLS
jgi:hypothetical protein